MDDEENRKLQERWRRYKNNRAVIKFLACLLGVVFIGDVFISLAHRGVYTVRGHEGALAIFGFGIGFLVWLWLRNEKGK